ncbi:MAG TPA: tetratricopeptide repeat protein [Terracidiphilus sp.]|nr:tetratricopeptide repeat protein [Terracidiphilus sp.]
MDTQTRHALKQDKFARAAASSASWLGEHRSGVLRWIISAAIALVVVIAGAVYWNMRTSAADQALGSALDVYTEPLATPGVPDSGTYTTAAARATEANREFVAIAHNFSGLPQASKAHYFAGVTYMNLGKNGPAETELKAAAGSWNRNLANLAKLALAGLYHQTGRDNDAIALYNQLAAKPSVTVSTSAAQLGLADLYAAEGKQDLAKAIWAKIKGTDKESAAATIAEEKLSGKGQ